ncbi:DUF3427 domain-containing protein [Thermobifida halotolerans]|uniref:DUF3427 domain-containing protein n=1 Tax=Thermobifida halotolerans TaxID=483545 RepID=A0A399FZB3_9ACTN|nr:DEAD/DEAH box helicase [Thermobifida halotolerans]UOE19568.1 DUF3427 domain-containing protein [Thermobifida halotolerans]
MPRPPHDPRPAAGLYESLLTDRLEQYVEELSTRGWRVVRGKVGEQSAPHVLARYVADRVERALDGLAPEERVAAANRILDVLGPPDGSGAGSERVLDGPRQLLALTDREEIPLTQRPATPLSEAALLTNAPDDPGLGSELRRELATADRIDLLCAFIKWHGLRWLEQPLRAARARGVPIRVITTTYLGATERRALDRLVTEFGAEVKINYETRSTRLHAKAWLFWRDSGYHTAYVGSSNLSRAALLDGLEWNVRLSAVATPAVLRKFAATFDSYWSDPAFEDYLPHRDTARLDEALAVAGGRTSPGGHVTLSGLEVRPFPHQRDMLEQLAAERLVHDRHRNLLVAATGTGKTVMAALDYRRLRHAHGDAPTLLFVAHRREILEHARRTYQEVLNDADFGELLFGAERPRAWRHVFAGIQALSARGLADLPSDHFDVVVVDEFHHASASTYRRLLDHVRPRELLGLTATPERADGVNVQDEFFGGRVAAELRLWEALDSDLLSPFHYFGISDSTDLSAVTWKRGGYDRDELSALFTGNDARARLVLRAVRDKVADPNAMRALGFCVSVAHAEYMAAFFRKAGLNARALSGRSGEDERREVLAGLRGGTVRVVFSVDLFNEGVDIPDVDTLLLLRPTSSATVFLQQLGRGLRRAEGKAVLTVLDLIGQHRREFRFDHQFRALTNLTRKRLVEGVEQGFPRLPSGCQIVLDPRARETVLANIRRQIDVTAPRLAAEIRSHGTPRLAEYLAGSGRDAGEVYRSGRSWTGLLRRAGLLPDSAPDGETALLRRVSAFLHVDDPVRADAYTRLLADDAPAYADLDERDRVFARMLFFSLWPDGGRFPTYQRGFDRLRDHPRVRDELRQVVAHGLAQARHAPVPLLLDTAPGLPLAVHASYSREEILPALGQSGLGGAHRRVPANFREGVKWCPNIATDALLVTLEKDERDFSPQTRYRDYALNERLFHWESQNRTSETSTTGLRYQRHREEGSHVLLFVRHRKTTDFGTVQPWMLLGPADYVEHRGSNPMGIVWRLHHEMPTDVWSYAAATAS